MTTLWASTITEREWEGGREGERVRGEREEEGDPEYLHNHFGAKMGQSLQFTIYSNEIRRGSRERDEP